ncbi:organic hydroperoxide resistance protein [Mariniflexile gromovii]|uniref:Organic hydroperoxide resistance protein n=1 Tax=Mariniflexile gromovii TaxID=362523 RepID=A0ABS4BNP9_9FLAO|nr:organic hydroperoxide resistance protein [Mariniflexile gromovii]MBP0902223.1 organic hydroperoxide resistance protein [Mariniflexile gromovii]
MKNEIQKVLYTAKTHTIGGRDGKAISSDGKLDIKLTPPGIKSEGTNPEQMFAAGWSACFLGALGLAAKKSEVMLPSDTSIDAEVDLGTTVDGFQLEARLKINMPGLDKDLAKQLAEMAHQTCPYSKAVKSNINVTIEVGVEILKLQNS